MYTEYKIDFSKCLEQEEDFINKYPLLNSYLNCSKEQSYLKYLPAFNEFTNSMVEKFSYHISREDAKNIELNKSEKYDKKNLIILLNHGIKYINMQRNINAEMRWNQKN